MSDATSRGRTASSKLHHDAVGKPAQSFSHRKTKGHLLLRSDVLPPPTGEEGVCFWAPRGALRARAAERPRRQLLKIAAPGHGYRHSTPRKLARVIDDNVYVPVEGLRQISQVDDELARERLLALLELRLLRGRRAGLCRASVCTDTCGEHAGARGEPTLVFARVRARTRRSFSSSRKCASCRKT